MLQCWITYRAGNMETAESDLIKWLGLAAGPDPVSHEAHVEAALQVKLSRGMSRGMKPRQRRQPVTGSGPESKRPGVSL